MRKLFLAFFVFTVSAIAQSPTPDPIEKVDTEEIRLTVSALDKAGNAVTDLSNEDLVISEDGRLHQTSSVRFLDPSVLIAVDTGGTIRQKKNIGATRSAASALAAELRKGTHFSVIQFHDRVEELTGWTTDKAKALTDIHNRTGFGRRSSFTRGVQEAGRILANAPTENRHLVLITDGLDTIEETAARSAAIRKLWQSGIVVHVISYTQMEFKGQKLLGGLLQDGEHNPRRMPEQVLEELLYTIPVKKTIARDILRQIYQPRLLSIIIDKPFLRAQKNQSKSLATAQVQLAVLSEYTGGEFYLPDTVDEMAGQARQIGQIINSQVVVTYTPKRPLKDSASDEIRQIDVSSRRAGIEIRASRKLIVFGPAETK